MTRNKEITVTVSMSCQFISLPWMWERDASAMHTTFQGTQDKKILTFQKSKAAKRDQI